MPRTRKIGNLALLPICLLLVISGKAQTGPYSLTVFADSGAHGSSVSQQASSGGSNMGHVFVELTNGDKHAFIGYYGDPRNPSKGQLRVDADLVSGGYWDVKKTYSVTKQGYDSAHQVIDTWGTSMGTWELWRNCGDFAEAIAQAAGVQLQGLPKELIRLNTPRSWASYLRKEGGTLNPQRFGNPSGSAKKYDPQACQPCLHQCSNGPVSAWHACMDACPCD